MYKYYVEGGSLFMGMLTTVFLIILVVSVIIGIQVFTSNAAADNKLKSRLGYIKSLGLLAFVMGMLGQFIGLFQAFDVISTGIDVTPALLAGGLKVSSITSIYGMIIFIISYILWFVLDILSKRKG